MKKKSLFKNNNTTKYNKKGLKFANEIEEAVTKIVANYEKNYFIRDIELIVSHASCMPVMKLELGLDLIKK